MVEWDGEWEGEWEGVCEEKCILALSLLCSPPVVEDHILYLPPRHRIFGFTLSFASASSTQTRYVYCTCFQATVKWGHMDTKQSTRSIYLASCLA